MLGEDQGLPWRFVPGRKTLLIFEYAVHLHLEWVIGEALQVGGDAKASIGRGVLLDAHYGNALGDAIAHERHRAILGDGFMRATERNHRYHCDNTQKFFHTILITLLAGHLVTNKNYAVSRLLGDVQINSARVTGE